MSRGRMQATPSPILGPTPPRSLASSTSSSPATASGRDGNSSTSIPLSSLPSTARSSSTSPAPFHSSATSPSSGPTLEEQLRDGLAEIYRLGQRFSDDAADDQEAEPLDLEAERAADHERERALAKCVCILQDFQVLFANSQRVHGVEDLGAILSACVSGDKVVSLVTVLTDLCASGAPMAYVTFNFLSLLILCDCNGCKRSHRGTLSGSSALLNKYLDLLQVELPAKKQTFTSAIANIKMISVSAAIIRACLSAVALRSSASKSARESGSEHVVTLEACLRFLSTLLDNCNDAQRLLVLGNRRCCKALTDTAAMAVVKTKLASQDSWVSTMHFCRSLALQLVCRSVTEVLIPQLPAHTKAALVELSHEVAVARPDETLSKDAFCVYSPMEKRMARRLGDLLLFAS
eukprot:INCI6774.1.p1 GENE.INCI6774.1~~INCI6774.1.p1  ORF type:complete len:406 (+),score=48.09 INCI6774.1:120-1337(+)